jgi:hypothetical protein
MQLLVGMVGRAHQWSGGDVLEIHFAAFLGEPGEHIRVHEALDEMKRLTLELEGKSPVIVSGSRCPELPNTARPL